MHRQSKRPTLARLHSGANASAAAMPRMSTIAVAAIACLLAACAHKAGWTPDDEPTIKTLAGRSGEVEKVPFKALVEDFYLTNPIARASAVMAECSRLASGHMLTAAE